MRRFIGISLLTFLFVLVCTVTAFAANDLQPPVNVQPDGLSLDEVINRALTKSTAVEQAEKDVDRAWEVRQSVRKWHVYSLSQTISTGDLYSSIPGADENSLFKFLSANGQWMINKKMLDLTKDAIVLQAKGNYYDVIKNQHKLETSSLALQKAESNYRKVAARATVGLATDVEVQAAKSLMQMEKSALEQAKADLENSYRTLNNLIGLKPEERPSLTTQLEFEKMDVESLENKIAWALSPDNNPYLWSKKEGYEISKYTWTFTEPDEAGLIDKEKAGITYQDARKRTRDKVYELYDSLKTLEASYESASEGIATAKEALRVAKYMYEVGMVTRDDVLEKEVALAKAEDGMLKIKSLYSLTKETFEKPWLAFVTGSPTGGAGSQATNNVADGDE